jgi:hypothetical protein
VYLTVTGLICNSISKGYPVKKNYQGRSRGRHHISLTIAGLLLVSLLSACSSGLQVRSDIDPTADFSQYKTYNFFEPMGIEGGYNSPIFGEHFRASIGGELARRRYQTSDKPDLLINVTIRGDDHVRMRSFTSPYMTGGYYGRPGGAYAGSAVGVGVSVGRPGGAYAGSAVGVGVSVGRSAKLVTEASVFIDFVDFEQRKIVWQGVAVINVNDKVAQQLRDAIFTSVNKVMAEYPHTAGN